DDGQRKILEIEGLAALCKQDALRGRRLSRASRSRPQANRNLPQLRRTLGKVRAIAKETTLRESDRGFLAVWFCLNLNQRHSRLVDEGWHNTVNRLAGGFRLRVPKVFRRNVSKRVNLQVGVNSGAKHCRALIG